MVEQLAETVTPTIKEKREFKIVIRTAALNPENLISACYNCPTDQLPVLKVGQIYTHQLCLTHSEIEAARFESFKTARKLELIDIPLLAD